MLVLARLRRADEDPAPELDAAVEVVGFALVVVAEEGEDVGWFDEGVEGGREGLGLGCGGGAHCSLVVGMSLFVGGGFGVRGGGWILRLLLFWVAGVWGLLLMTMVVMMMSWWKGNVKRIRKARKIRE